MTAFYEGRSHWLQAFGISLICHGVAAAAMLDVLPEFPRRQDDQPLPQIEVTSIDIDSGNVAATDLVAMQPVTPEAIDPGLGQPDGTGDGPEAVAPDSAILSPVDATGAAPGESLTPAEDLAAATTAAGVQTVSPIRPPLRGDPQEPPTPDASQGAGGPTLDSPQSRALADLVGDIRQQMDEACLVALPQTVGADQVQLTVVGSGDQEIAGFMSDITAGGVAVPLTERSVLLDARQCPALAYARSATSYPVFPLRMSLPTQEIASGGRLVGRVNGAGQAQVILLLVDDNGVVQDLTRFSRQTGDALEFDVPVRRAGAARDTSQLLIALAAPQRPATITERDGRLAADFFPALEQEAGRSVQLGVLPFYLR